MASLFDPTGAVVARDYETNGVPASGAHKIVKAELRDWMATAEGLLAAGSGGIIVKDTLANLNADLAHPQDTGAEVLADPTPANNGVYRKLGPSGGGSWQKISDTGVAALSQEVAELQLAVTQEQTARIAEDTALGTDIDSKLPLAGGTMTGALILASDPASALQAATKQYADNIGSGFQQKAAVNAASTGNVNVASAPAALDGVTGTAGHRWLLKDQTAAAENGIYAFSAGGAALVRTNDMDFWTEIPGALVSVLAGTANANTVWLGSGPATGTIGTTPASFVRYGPAGASAYGQQLIATTSAFNAGTVLAINYVDVFLVAGQSNATGQGDSTLSPTVPPGKVLQWKTSGGLVDANDPVGGVTGFNNANTGSAWPAFGLTWYAATGRIICFVPCGHDGSALTQAAATWQGAGTGNWDTSGTFYPAAKAALDSALSALNAAGYTPVLRGTLWSQGETDAQAIFSSPATVNKALFKAALINLIGRFRADYGAQYPFLIFRSGRSDSTPEYPNNYWQGIYDVRDAQEEVAAADPHTFVVCREAVGWQRRGLYEDDLHYNQVALNEMGRIGAAGVASHAVYTGFITAPRESIFTTAYAVGFGDKNPTVYRDNIESVGDTIGGGNTFVHVDGTLRVSNRAWIVGKASVGGYPNALGGQLEVSGSADTDLYVYRSGASALQLGATSSVARIASLNGQPLIFSIVNIQKAMIDNLRFSLTVPVKLQAYTVAGVPAGQAGDLVYISNETGGAVIAFSDGTNWRRVTDRAVIA